MWSTQDASAVEYETSEPRCQAFTLFLSSPSPVFVAWLVKLQGPSSLKFPELLGFAGARTSRVGGHAPLGNEEMRKEYYHTDNNVRPTDTMDGIGWTLWLGSKESENTAE